MGLSNSKNINNNNIVKINNNQLNIQDYILIKILDYLNEECKLHNISNPLERSLVCSYWMIYIVPRATTRITTTFLHCKFLDTFPQSLQRLYKSITLLKSLPSSVTTTSPQPEIVSNSTNTSTLETKKKEFNAIEFLSLEKLTLINNDDSQFVLLVKSKERERALKNEKVFNYALALIRHWGSSFRSLTLVNFNRNHFLGKVFQSHQFRLDSLRMYPSYFDFETHCNRIPNEYYDLANHFVFHSPFRNEFRVPIYSIGENVQSYKMALQMLPVINQNLPKLERLHLYKNSSSYHYPGFRPTEKIISYLGNLRELKLEYCYQDLITPKVPALTSLAGKSATIAEIPFEPLLCRLKNLEKLSIKGTANLTTPKIIDMIIMELRGLAPQLRVLKLSKLFDCSLPVEVVSLIDSMVNLERLSLDVISPELCDSYLLIQTSSKLKKLTVPMAEFKSFKLFLSNNNIIESLVVKKIDRVDSAMELVRELIKNENNTLKRIKLVGESLITDSLININSELSKKGIQLESNRDKPPIKINTLSIGRELQMSQQVDLMAVS